MRGNDSLAKNNCIKTQYKRCYEVLQYEFRCRVRMSRRVELGAARCAQHGVQITQYAQHDVHILGASCYKKLSLVPGTSRFTRRLAWRTFF